MPMALTFEGYDSKLLAPDNWKTKHDQLCGLFDAFILSHGVMAIQISSVVSIHWTVIPSFSGCACGRPPPLGVSMMSCWIRVSHETHDRYLSVLAGLGFPLRFTVILLFVPKPMCESSKRMSFHTCVDVGIMIIEYPGCTLVHMLFLDD